MGVPGNIFVQGKVLKAEIEKNVCYWESLVLFKSAVCFLLADDVDLVILFILKIAFVINNL